MGAIAVETVISWTDAQCRDHHGALVTRAKGYDVISCAVCGFRHVVPLPEPAELERVYREAYYTEEKPTFLSHAGEDEEWAALASRDRLEIFERLLRGDRRHILDVGCGPGYFLKVAKERGWSALGLEPSRQAAEHARGLGIEIVENFFNAATARTLGRFEVVHLNNVLEHVPNPIDLVALAHGLIKPGGLICLNVPNDFTPFQASACSALALPEWWVAPPHHLNYFDFRTLSELVTRAGFEVSERATSFPMELFLLMGLDYTKDPALGLACHNQRKRFDLGLEKAGFQETRRAFYRALAAAGIGREAVVIARKR
jgi:2-polyprenyl-3-methyl-5-hydroxy-6-metoxy-1,4-benzoquinol methylase